ncbi:MAG: HAMP domain-containing protein, partial [bacterium]|nr:HAMP domain-containing protein [bacterium]
MMKSLTSKVLLILVFVLVLYAAGEYMIQRLVIFPSFLALEQDEAQKDVERSVQAISREVHHLDSLCHDWAAWNDTYEFIQAPSEHEEYVDANLVIASFTNSELNLIYLLDAEGKVTWGQIYDLETEETIGIADFPNDAFPKTHPLISYEIVEELFAKTTVNGIFMTEQGPMLIAARPILNSAHEGPVCGTLLMGRLLNESIVNTLVEQTRVDFQIFPIQTAALPEAIRDIPNQITTESPYLMKERGESELQVYTTVPDIQGNAALLLSATIPRKISERGVVTTRVALLSILVAGVLILLIILALLRQIVLKPISSLTDHTLSIGKTGDLSARTAVARSDEIGVLSKEFDKMLAQLADARKKLMDQSYNSGMAEMASGILHNVRNSLSPVLGQLDLLRGSLRKIPFSQLEMAQKELDEGSASEARRQDLIKFALLSNKSLTAIANDTKVTLNETAERIGQIEQILDDHQQWAYGERVEEAIPFAELVHDAIQFITEESHGSLAIHLDPGLTEVGAVMGHRLSLLQVFENLLLNAAESIQRT